MQGPDLKVFISYSRSDSQFANLVVEGLEFDGGYDIFIDEDSIHVAEDWKMRLLDLIKQADVVVFLLSEASAASEICAWEVKTAAEYSKRIVPVLIKAAPEEIDPPKELTALNYVRFDNAPTFISGLKMLSKALRTDLSWVREHTRLLGRAEEWEASGRLESRLLVGQDIALANEWLHSAPPESPGPTERHRAFIAASEIAEDERKSEDRKRVAVLQRANTRSRWALAGASLFGLVAAAGGVGAYYQWDAAEKSKVEIDRVNKQLTSSIQAGAVRLEYDILEELFIHSQSMGLIKSKRGNPKGAGFMVSANDINPDWPNEPVVLTANHIVSNKGDAPSLQTTSAQFCLGDIFDNCFELSHILFESDRHIMDVSVLALSDEYVGKVHPITIADKHKYNEYISGTLTGENGNNSRLAGLYLGEGATKRYPAIARVLETSYADFDERSRTTARNLPIRTQFVTGPGASGSPVFDLQTGELVCIHSKGASPGRDPLRDIGYSQCNFLGELPELLRGIPFEEPIFEEYQEEDLPFDEFE